MILRTILVLTILINLSFIKILAEEIPIIVIAPSKKPQSLSTVGTSVSVYDENTINQSNDYFLGDVLGDGTTSFNYFQTGGHGSSSGK